MTAGGDLAFTLQEVLTAIVRLRANRSEVTDAAAFRANFIDNLKVADNSARQNGYSSEDVKLAMFVVVALLDETVLNCRIPTFADWHKEPLAQSLFGRLDAGELVFTNIETLLGRDDSAYLADVLEVYYLCLLLGFSGRYHIPSVPELGPIRFLIRNKIERIRGPRQLVFPAALPPSGSVTTASDSDSWVRRLMWAAAIVIAICLASFAIMHHRLATNLEEIRAISVTGLQ